MNEIRIAHVTDLHVPPDDELRYGVKIRPNVERLLQDLQSWEPDFLVVGGDLAYMSAERESYEWVKERLDCLPFPVIVQPGNHDSLGIMGDYFTLPEGIPLRGCFEFSFGGRDFLFLDSSSGKVDETMLEYVRGVRGDFDACFIHHPVVPSGVPYMEANYPLTNREELADQLGRWPGIPVFSGHYHGEHTVQTGGLVQFVTPTAYFTISADSRTMVIENHRIGWRKIILGNSGYRTSVRWLEGNFSQGDG